MGRIGLLGGTFDPPHFGHLWLAATAQEQLKLERILFLPAGAPPHKLDQEVTAVSHRLPMLQRAIAGNDSFRIDTTDAKRPPPHTTVTLLPLLQQRFPESTFWLLIGSDSLRDLPTWVEPAQIVQQCRLAVLPRPSVMVDEKSLQAAVPGAMAVVDWLHGPQINLSSTEIRDWAAKGHSLEYLVPTAVARYITKHQLYRQQRS